MSFEIIMGFCFGIEVLEDEDDKYLCIELGILRILVNLNEE